mmetsp:Transcript_6072/g.10240  ORF Transcript_6072/g.10240 Transcript_6072/m.10240 type:complete len:573 (-) Transcript_6072:87-1805(-)
MFIAFIQAVVNFISDLVQNLLTLIGGAKDKNKKDDWAYDTYNPDYFQPQLYNAQQGTPMNFRHRGFSPDVDRNTNQASQSAATLPRPFYAPVRQHNAPNNLVNRAGQGNQQHKQKQSVVELLLQQQNEVVEESTPLLGLPQQTNQSESSAESFDQLAPLPHDSTISDHSITEHFITENNIQSSVPSYKYEPPKLLSPGGNQLGGLRGTRPLVKLDRMSFIAKMMREGKDGVSMGDYAPDSRLHSINLGESPSSSGQQSTGETLAATDAVLNTEEHPRIRNLAYSAYPTLDLKDLSLLDIIGGGGFGQVWRGTWGGTPVAVKLLSNLLLPAGPNNANSPPNAEQAALLTAFEEEVSMLAQLRHPNICLFLGVCLEPPHRAIVTELVSRGSLWDCLRVKGLFQQKELPWPVGIMRRVLEGTCRGLVYLHRHSPPIIHRDLKSANLLLDETFNVKICDFGLARLRDYNTVLTANVGTIHWMAPEVLTGNLYNESADIYSMGIVIWEMFTGLCPYDSMKQVEVALSVVQKGLRPVIPTTCTTAQANIIRKCWDTDPTVRYTAEELLQAVDIAFPVK